MEPRHISLSVSQAITTDASQDSSALGSGYSRLGTQSQALLPRTSQAAGITAGISRFKEVTSFAQAQGGMQTGRQYEGNVHLTTADLKSCVGTYVMYPITL